VNKLGIWAIAIAAVFAISLLAIPEADSQTTIPTNKPDGIILSHDERIYIVQHSGYSLFEGIEGIFEFSDSIIYGDIVNLSDDTVYYIIMRGNVYKDEQLWQKTGYQQKWIFRYDYPVEAGNPTELANSPSKVTLKPGEATPFVLWPGQVGWDCYEVWVETYELENIAEDITDERVGNDIVIKSGELDNKGNFKGKLYNPTEVKIDIAFVNLVKYDTNDKIFAIRGEVVGVLSPGKEKSYEIPVYVTGFPIKTHTDNFLYGEPHRIEVIAGGQTGWSEEGDFEDYDEKHPARFVFESQYYPNEPRPQYMNLEELREKAKQDHQKPINTKFCQGGEELVFPGQTKPADASGSKVLAAKTKIPDWVRNTAKWWSEGGIGDSDFVSGIQYLIKQRIMQIPLSEISEPEDDMKNKAVTEQGYLEIDGKEFFVSRYNPVTITISGEVKDYGAWIECDFFIPGELYEEKLRFIPTRDEIFNHPLIITSDFPEGEYQIDCKYKNRDFGSLSFSVIKTSSEKPVVKESPTEKTVPEWIKNNADWWSQGLISDDDFVKGIQYLVEQGIIVV